MSVILLRARLPLPAQARRRHDCLPGNPTVEFQHHVPFSSYYAELLNWQRSKQEILLHGVKFPFILSFGFPGCRSDNSKPRKWVADAK
jgi:hypothetical protein